MPISMSVYFKNNNNNVKRTNWYKIQNINIKNIAILYKQLAFEYFAGGSYLDSKRCRKSKKVVPNPPEAPFRDPTSRKLQSFLPQ